MSLDPNETRKLAEIRTRLEALHYDCARGAQRDMRFLLNLAEKYIKATDQQARRAEAAEARE